MQPKSIAIGGGLFILLMIAFSACLPKQEPVKQAKKQTEEQAQQVQPEPKLTTLKCNMSGYFEGFATQTKKYAAQEIGIQFNRETSEVTLSTESHMQKVEASISPDLILFKTVSSSDNSISVDHYQIDRKSLAFTNWGDQKYFSQDSDGDIISSWKYEGTCQKVVANIEGNKI